jgi:hypothetical protein
MNENAETGSELGTAATHDLVTHDLIPVPHAATVELGRDRDCPRNCKACSFNETPLEKLSVRDVLHSMAVLSHYWDDIKEDPNFQLVGARFIEFLGIAGAMDRYSDQDLQKIIEAAGRYNLAQIAFMCDAFMDKRAIKTFFEVEPELKTGESSPKRVIALSVDTLPVKDPLQGRQLKSTQSWEMLANRSQYIKNPENQNFRVFTTISRSNLKDIPKIAARVLEGGNLLFIAPITAHSEEMLAKAKVTGKLLMGSDTSDLLTEEDAPAMGPVVEALRALKAKYPALFLNGEANFENMLAACKPLTEVFRNNCRESCKFTVAGGEELNCTPNIRIVKKPGDKDMSLATCTCFVGLTGDGEHYADTPLSYLEYAGTNPEYVVAMYRKLTRDLAEIACPGCNCRTAIDIKKGGLK